MSTTTIINQIQFDNNDFFAALDVQVASSSDTCILNFPNTENQVSVTITAENVGTTGSYVRFNVAIIGNTLSVWKCSRGTNVVISNTSSTDIGNLTKMTIAATTGTNVSIVQTGCYALSPQAMIRRSNRSYWMHVAVFAVLIGGIVGASVCISNLAKENKKLLKNKE